MATIPPDWRKEFEAHGEVKMRYLLRNGAYQGRAGAIVDWLAELEDGRVKQEREKYERMYRLTLIGVALAGVAAITGVIALLR